MLSQYLILYISKYTDIKTFLKLIFICKNVKKLTANEYNKIVKNTNIIQKFWKKHHKKNNSNYYDMWNKINNVIYSLSYRY
jgi:hypothetical protein